MAIPNQTITNHHIGEVKHEFKAGIRSEDFPHIANLLINLYGDPITAVIREYSTNALDSHIDAGLRRPIEVTLPTSVKPEFVVQDFGVGLSIDDLENVYSMYGRSTKRDSNDAVGQLGLGCKSGLTYADAFTITAVKNGVKCVAQSTKDEHGVGTIHVIDTVSTTEPNGVRIAIPVKERDIHAFAEKAESLFQFWDAGTVLVNGEAPEVPEWRKQALALDDDTFVVPTANAVEHGLYQSFIIMGNVPYPIQDITVPGKGRNRDTYRRVVVRVNMGDVDFVPSREAIHYTTHTDECLAELTQYITERFDKVLNERLSDTSSRWEETLLKVQWKGSGVRINANVDMPMWDYEPNGWGKTKARGQTSYAYANLVNTNTLIVTKFPNKSLATAHRKRLAEFAPDTKRFLVIPTGVDAAGLQGRENVVEWDEILDETDVAPDPVTGKRVKRDETKYDIVGGSPLTAAEIAKLPGPKFLIHRKESTKYGTFGGTVVQMYSANQESRLRRIIPELVSYRKHVTKLTTEAEAAVTDEDRKLVAARSLGNPWSKLDADEVADPILAEAIRLSDAPLTDTLTEAAKFGLFITGNFDNIDLDEYLSERYPLVSMRHYYYSTPVGEDVLFYINAKHAQIEAQESLLDAEAS